MFIKTYEPNSINFTQVHFPGLLTSCQGDNINNFEFLQFINTNISPHNIYPNEPQCMCRGFKETLLTYVLNGVGFPIILSTWLDLQMVMLSTYMSKRDNLFTSLMVIMTKGFTTLSSNM